MSKPIQSHVARKGAPMPLARSQRQNAPSTEDFNLNDEDRDAILREIAEGAEQADAYGRTLERALRVTEKDLRTQVSI